MNKMTWLHLSDLHLRAGNEVDELDRDIVLKTFFSDLEQQISNKDLKFDCIFFSGDIAFSGKTDEYDLAMTSFFDPLLAITRVPKSKLFVVPGNHDVDWDRMDRIVTAGMRETLKTRRDVNEFLRPGKDRNREFSKFDAYGKFVRSYFDGSFDFSSDKYFYTIRFDVQGCTIAVMGLNTAWMSACYQNSAAKPQDQGKLLIGDFQLQQALKETEGANLRIVTLHHPVDWLNEDIERFQVERQIEAKCHFILHGHWHNAKFYYKDSNSGQAIFIPAGALYQGLERPNGYNFVQLDLETGQGKITLRRFQSDGAQGPVWMKDIVTTGENKDGVIEFSIPVRSSPSPLRTDMGINMPTAAGVPRSQLKKILMAEDGQNWQNLLKRILMPDYDVDVASSYNDVKIKLNNSYDAIIINLCLETDNDFLGEAVLNVINERADPIPCIVMTGSHQPTRGLYERYPFVREVFIKGGREEKNFPSSKFLDIVKQVVGS
jgi:hypothetical protein